MTSTASLPRRHRRKHPLPSPTSLISRSIILSIILSISATQVQAQQTYFVIKPSLVSVAFFAPSKTPSSYLSASAFGTLTATSSSRVKNNNQPPQFRFSYEAATLSYTFSPTSTIVSGSHTLRLGLIDPLPDCQPGQRSTVYNVNGVDTRAIDIASEQGCQKTLYVDVSFNLSPGENIILQFTQTSTLKPGISNLRLYEGSAPPIPSSNPRDFDVSLDISPSLPIPATVGVTADGAVKTRKIGMIPKTSFSTGREGSDFTILFEAPSGSYDVILGFAELQRSSCEIGSRVFNVYINSKLQLPAFDIFQTAKRCLKSVVRTFSSVSVDIVDSNPLTVRFEGIAGNALVSFIRVKSSGKQCVPATTDAEITDDHLAHSVPGTYKSFVDTTGKGKISVKIDGRSSHTHFFAKGITGRIIDYKWTIVETGEVISKNPRFEREFPLGSTRLRLDIIDNICSQDDAETVITVTGSRQPGQYCYYYTGLTELPPPARLELSPIEPVFASVFKVLKLNGKTLPFADTNFVIRCQFFIEFDTVLGFTNGVIGDAQVVVKTSGGGDVRVYKGEELILDSVTSEKSSVFSVNGGESQPFEVMFVNRNDPKNLKLNFKINNRTPKSVFHDKATVQPIITSLSPASGPAVGGTRVRIRGFGLISPMKVFFGGVQGTVVSIDDGNNNIFVSSPPFNNPGTVLVIVEGSNGLRSKSLLFEYGGVCDPPQFTRTEMTFNGGPPNLESPTAVSIFSNGRLYFGTREGRVRVITYDPISYAVSNMCHSEILYDDKYKLPNGLPSPRSVLGITFDPKDRRGKPFVSTSTLFWLNQKKIDPNNRFGWSNGNIERLKPVKGTKFTSGVCMERQSIVVSGLPVGAADHSVNELIFDQNGDLLIAVAGLTNAGLPGRSWGGIWESYYSGSIVKAKLSRGKLFNGKIEYINGDDGTRANPTANTRLNFQLYATGFRNLFSLIMARNGEVFGIDMGQDCKFGHISSSCSEYNPNTEGSRNRNINLQGKVIIGAEGECKYSGERNDKVLKLEEGKWYGHPNLQRAAIDNDRSHECAWVDPKSGRSPLGNMRPPSQYVNRITLLSSPMTGLREYGSNLFCGKMKGNLVISRYKETKSLRLERNTNGGPIDITSIELTSKGALRVEENELGDLIYPRFGNANDKGNSFGVTVLKANVRSKAGLFISNTQPWRHSRKGKSLLRVGGWGFSKDAVSVFVGGNPCPVKSVVSQYVIVCKVPKWTGGDNRVDVRVVGVDGSESTMPGGLVYMNV